MIWPPQITRRDLVLIAQTLQRPLRLSAMPLGFEARNGSVALWVRSMCNLYSVTKNQAAIRDLFKVGRDTAGNLPPLPAIFPGERELIMTLRAARVRTRPPRPMQPEVVATVRYIPYGSKLAVSESRGCHENR
jgi:hypothetical protein